MLALIASHIYIAYLDRCVLSVWLDEIVNICVCSHKLSVSKLTKNKRLAKSKYSKGALSLGYVNVAQAMAPRELPPTKHVSLVQEKAMTNGRTL